jgi:hypothetical protein
MVNHETRGGQPKRGCQRPHGQSHEPVFAINDSAQYKELI